mgnify:CR=1 FL=1
MENSLHVKLFLYVIHKCFTSVNQMNGVKNKTAVAMVTICMATDVMVTVSIEMFAMVTFSMAAFVMVTFYMATIAMVMSP